MNNLKVVKPEKNQLQMFCIMDTKAKRPINPPSQDDNYDTAIRSFSVLVNDPKTVMNMHPEDYHLMHVGYWEPEKMLLTPQDPPTSVISAVSLKKNLDKGENTTV